MFELKSEDLVLKVYKERDVALVSVVDLSSDTTWGPTPAFAMEILSIVLRREGCGDTETTIEAGDGWIEVTQTTDDLVFSASVTVRFSIQDGEVVARILAGQIKEPRPELSLLAGVSLLPDLMSAGKGGCLLLPIRNGALCYPECHPNSSERFLIYGEQHQWELMPMLPYCGAVRKEGVSALIAIADQGECDAQCRVDIDPDGQGSAGFSMRYRHTMIDPVDPIERVVRFVPLSGKEAGYAGVGRRMQRYVLEKSGRGTLAERAAVNPDIAYAANSFVLKIMHACKEIGSIDGTGELKVFTTFDQAREKLSALKEAGIEKLYVQLTGWNLEGHDGAWPTRFPVEPALGGEDALRRLIEYGQSLGYQMQVHDNYADFMLRSPDFNGARCVGSLYGGPLKRGCWAGGINYPVWGLSYTDDELSGQLAKVKDLGASGIAYLDAMGIPLEVSYNEAQGEARYRRACADGVNRIVRAARETYGAASVETGYLYCAMECDYIGSTFLEKVKLTTDLADTFVPVWLMAVKGFVIVNLTDTMQGAIDFGHNADQTISERMLTMAEYGLLPRNEITATRGSWGYPLEPTLEAMLIEYKLIVNELSNLAYASLTDHQILERDKDKYVSLSTFSDGTTILADHIHSRLEINGRDYPLPNGYKKRPA